MGNIGTQDTEQRQAKHRDTRHRTKDEDKQNKTKTQQNIEN